MSILNRASTASPPYVWFGVSAIFHYLGPAFAVLLFPAVGVLGIVWFRIATAAAVFAPWTHPWKTIRNADRQTRWLLYRKLLIPPSSIQTVFKEIEE